MNIKSSICGIQNTCINFLIFLIITKIECWPVFRQDPREREREGGGEGGGVSHAKHLINSSSRLFSLRFQTK